MGSYFDWFHWDQEIGHRQQHFLQINKKRNKAKISQPSYLIRKWFGFKYLYRMWQRVFYKSNDIFVRTSQAEDFP